MNKIFFAFLCVFAALAGSASAENAYVKEYNDNKTYDILGYKLFVKQNEESISVRSETRFVPDDAHKKYATFFTSVSCSIKAVKLDGVKVDYDKKKGAANWLVGIPLSGSGDTAGEHIVSMDSVCKSNSILKEQFYISKKRVNLVGSDSLPYAGNPMDDKFTVYMEVTPLPGFLPYIPFTEIKGSKENPVIVFNYDNGAYYVPLTLYPGYFMTERQLGDYKLTAIMKKDTLEESDMDLFYKQAKFVIDTLVDKYGPLNNNHFFAFQNIDDSFDGHFANTYYGLNAIYLGGSRMNTPEKKKDFTGAFGHEMTHWWFPCLAKMADDEPLYMTMSEGLASYGEQIIAEASPYGFDRTWPNFYKYWGYLNIVSKNPGGEIALDKLPSKDDDINGLAYFKGFMTFHALRYMVGDAAFYSILKRLVREHRDTPFREADFVRICEEESGKELSWFFDNIFHTTKHIDLAIKKVEAVDDGEGGTKLKVTVADVGDFKFEDSVDISVATEKGIKMTYREKLDSGEKTFDWGFHSKIMCVEIDPHMWIPDANRSNNIYIVKVNEGSK